MGFLISLFNVLIVLTSIFLICLVLIQRGKGGGLAGAFGGAGGSSAFGTKAGDIFTRITMFTALAWIVMLMILVVLIGRSSSVWVDDTSATGGGPGLPGAPAAPGAPGGAGAGSEIVPPPPMNVPSPDSSAPRTAPDTPPVSASGPSAPLPVSPLPAPTTTPATKPAETPTPPKS